MFASLGRVLHRLSPASLSVSSIQRQKAGLLLVRGQIRAAPARLRREGARRRPVLQLRDPIGAEQDGGWEGEIERKKNCKQTETLRILGERSRDGSADIWMFAVSIRRPRDLFLRQGESKRRKKELQCELICHGWTPHKLFAAPDPQRTRSEKRIYISLNKRKQSFVLVALKLRTNKQQCTRVQAWEV